MSNRKCECELCVKWAPLIERVRAKLEGPDLELFDEFVLHWCSESDDLCCANAKLAGDWPGWEWMKTARQVFEK